MNTYEFFRQLEATLPKALLVASMFFTVFTLSCTKPEPTEPVMPPEPKEYQLPVDPAQDMRDSGESGGALASPNDAPAAPKEDLLEDVPEAPPVMEEATKDDGLKQKVKPSKKSKSKKQNTKKSAK